MTRSRSGKRWRRSASKAEVVSLTGGQVHDITQAEVLLSLIEPAALLGDKGYDADHFVDRLTARAIKVVIPPKSNRKVKRDCDFALSASAISSNDSSAQSSIFGRSRPAMRRPRETSWPDYIWSARSLGSKDDRP